MTQKRLVVRPFPPDFVSAETLAYRLDFSRSTIDDYVRRGLLPKPLTVGAGQRWYWPDVLKSVFERSGLECPGEEDDPYLEGIKRA